MKRTLTLTLTLTLTVAIGLTMAALAQPGDWLAAPEAIGGEELAQLNDDSLPPLPPVESGDVEPLGDPLPPLPPMPPRLGGGDPTTGPGRGFGPPAVGGGRGWNSGRPDQAGGRQRGFGGPQGDFEGRRGGFAGPGFGGRGFAGPGFAGGPAMAGGRGMCDGEFCPLQAFGGPDGPGAANDILPLGGELRRAAAELRPFWRNDRIREQGKLTEDQVKKLDENFDKTRSALIDLAAEMAHKRIALEEATRADEQNLKTIEKAIEDLGQSRIAVEKAIAAYRFGIHETLNAEQREQLKTLERGMRGPRAEDMVGPAMEPLRERLQNLSPELREEIRNQMRERRDEMRGDREKSRDNGEKARKDGDESRKDGAKSRNDNEGDKPDKEGVMSRDRSNRRGDKA